MFRKFGKSQVGQKSSSKFTGSKLQKPPAGKLRFSLKGLHVLSAKLANYKVSTKLFITMAVSVAALIIVGVIGFTSLGKINGEMERLYSKNLQGVKAAADAERAIRGISEAGIRYSIETDTFKQQAIRQEVNKHAFDFNKTLNEYKKIVANEKEKAIVNHLEENFRKYQAAMDELITSFSQERALKVFAEQVKPSSEDTFQALQDLVDYNEKSAEKKYKDSVALYIAVSFGFVLIVAASVLLSFILNIAIIRTINNPLKLLNEAAGRVAAGDLREEKVEIQSKDEIGQLAGSFNMMIMNLKAVIKQIAEGAENLAASAEQMSATMEQESQAVSHLAQSAQELAVGAEEQSSKVQDSIAYVEETSAGVQQIAATAQQVAAATQEVSRKANEGNSAMTLAKEEMEKINAATGEVSAIINELGGHSKTIGNIVTLIGGIAEQTNLLALNAAIEAARAGEQGRGFAVVAEEVRKLAGESQQAAKEIASLVNRIQQDSAKAVSAMDSNRAVVEKGSKVIWTGAENFQQIAHAVEGILQQVVEVSKSTNELVTNSEHIVSTIKAIDQITLKVAEGSQIMASTTEEQAAAVEEVGASVESLASLGQDLKNTVSRFSL